MSDIRTLASEEMLEQLPRVLYEDESMYALAAAIAGALETVHSQLDLLNIYGALDAASEAILDILAEDLGIEWYSAEYTAAEKLYVIKTAWSTYSKLGTKAAVVEGLQTVTDGTVEVSEWFETDGDPYTFTVSITDGAEGDMDRALKILRMYKPVRAWLAAYIQTVTIAATFAVHYGTLACLDSVDEMVTYDTEEPTALSWVGSAIVGTSLVC